MHLIGFGPRRLDAKGRAIDDPGTWLEFSDLVFVDPIGTGYSRPVKTEYGPAFYQTRGDAEAVAEFIRVYRTRFTAEDAPLFLAGESFGVTRAAAVSAVLQRRGITVNGAVLIGLALPLGQLTPQQRAALNVPTYTAAAFAHTKLPAELQSDMQGTLRKAEQWALERYLPALVRRDELSDADRATVVAELARFSGIDPQRIDRKTLEIPMPQFSELLLQAEDRMVGRYDSRMTAPFDPEQQKMYDPTKDPSLKDLISDVGIVRYFRSELGYESDLNYQGPFGGGYPPPTSFRGDWMSVKWNRKIPEPEQPLTRAMELDPSLRVLSSCGYYDLVCSYFANEYVASQLPPNLKSRVTVRNYGGGHAIYTEDQVRMEMKRDTAAFMQASVTPVAPAMPAAPVTPAALADPATTRHQISVGGRVLRYTARAGTLPIAVNETGEVHGHVFYVAYTLDRTGPAPRPLTFLWNGGPGSNSSLLHLTGFGPRRFRSAHDSPPSACGCELQDNEATWLEHSDLVFVDPVGTGFSRPTRAEYGAEFYNTLGDIASIAEFVRVYLTRFDAWDAPLFVAGESYGAWRASGVAESLERRDIRVAGVMLISGGIQLGPVIDDEMRTALFIPTRAAAALHHGKLAADLQQDRRKTLGTIETWAKEEYGPALKRVSSLTDQDRDAIVGSLSRFTGLASSQIDRQTLVIGRQQFAEQLLADRKQVLARFDTRDTGQPAAGNGQAAAIANYLRSTLGFRTDLAYQGAEEGFTPSTGTRLPSVRARWNYNQNPQAPPPEPGPLDAPPGGPQPWLRRAMAINPSLKTFVAAGLYDSLNSCAANAFLVVNLEPAIQRQVTAACYEGGHMMYDEPAIRVQMTNDIAAFVKAATAR